MTNALRNRRMERGLSQQELADRAGVTRQTVSGIEAGTVSASMAVGLRLARALGCRVEDLFWLEDEPAAVAAAPVEDGPAIAPGTRVQLARLGDRLLAYPLLGSSAIRSSLYTADGVVERSDKTGKGKDQRRDLRVRLFGDTGLAERTVVVAGCDPALALLAEQTQYRSPGTRVVWTSAGSASAAASLAANRVHVAGIHWHGDSRESSDDGETANLSFARRALEGRPAVLVNVAYWEQGWLVAPGNPKEIRGAADLARRGVKLANRESGSSARRMLDRELRRASVEASRVRGYRWELPGHLELAREIAEGRADAGIGIAPAARVFGLDFIPLARERFDLIVPLEHLESAPVRNLLEVLAHRSFRTELEAIGGYDTSQTGRVVAQTTTGKE